MRIRIANPFDTTSRFLAGSFAGHALLVVAFVALPGLLPRPTRIEAPVVALVRAAPVLPPSHTEEAPGPPARPEPPPEPPPEPRPAVTPPVREKPAPDPRPALPKPSRPTPAPPREAPPEPTPNPAPVVDPVPPGNAAPQGEVRRGDRSITALEGGSDVELGWYKAQVTAALYREWKKPIVARLEDVREVRIEFEIDRAGRLVRPSIAQESGVPSLDRSALRAVYDAAPFPALPPNWKEPRLTAGFVFRLYPE